ncbi:bifunctional helix-turn-helix transcriptional regulator/GNAT family N-acetyltransferase [Metapseudomonas otitidis]|uniref:bifunctional helix-turn-helix transcriptional regulator/GNAT family N-acetyltransferase n=1 Tax=Metapseudomonas otitidis TaxID=319939 RepID=UPI001AAF20CF|nr:helix-turn-helix domain-containing GNAT family N-acetyltransferase [Pseudomonas otitidis]MBO2926752.1 MarR family transcriptional regulator [Pseudomonas otitidis]
MEHQSALIERVRHASRAIVRELGFMDSTLAQTRYPASSVHALLEVGVQGQSTAAQIAQRLNLDKSSVSRLLKKLIAAGELQEADCQRDARIKLLSLTAKGRHTLEAINRHAEAQVESALGRLPSHDRGTVAAGLALYAQALGSMRGEHAGATLPSPQLYPGYRPGLIGRITQMHADFYARNSGFGQVFESQVASGLADFCERLVHPCNQLWTAVAGEHIVGSIAIDGQSMGHNEAHLRWFMLEEAYHGHGLGRCLLETALGFCDTNGFDAVHLWTFSGLDAARHLYEKQGFVLRQAREGSQWGTSVIEQHFIRTRR